MTNRGIWFHSPILVLLSFSFGAVSADSNAANKYPALSMHGENYPNACEPSQRKALRGLLRASRPQDSERAWRAIDAMLCSPSDDANRHYLKTLVPRKIKETVESTGDQPEFKLVARSDRLISGLMADGKAWDADIRVESTKIVVQYFANEACVRSRTLTFENLRWSLTEVGEACD